MTVLPPRRALRQLLGGGRAQPVEPLAREGYSIPRRVLAGLLGVRLLPRSQQAQATGGAAISTRTDSTSLEGRQDRQASTGDVTETNESLWVQQSAEADITPPQVPIAERFPARSEPIRAAAIRLPTHTPWRYRRAFGTLTKEIPPLLDNFTPGQVDEDAARAHVVNMVSDMELNTAVDEGLGYVLDNAINAMVEQWVQSIHVQHAAYQARAYYLHAAAGARLRANLAALPVDKLRLDDAEELLSTSEGRRARKRATKSSRKAFLLYARAQARLAHAEAASDYYAAVLQAADRVRDEAVLSRLSLGAELKQLVRLEMAKRLRDISAADELISSPEPAERMPSGSDHPVEE